MVDEAVMTSISARNINGLTAWKIRLEYEHMLSCTRPENAEHEMKNRKVTSHEISRDQATIVRASL